MAVLYAVAFVGLALVALAVAYLAWTRKRARDAEIKRLEMELEHERRMEREGREYDTLMEFAEDDARDDSDPDRDR